MTMIIITKVSLRPSTGPPSQHNVTLGSVLALLSVGLQCLWWTHARGCDAVQHVKACAALRPAVLLCAPVVAARAPVSAQLVLMHTVQPAC